MSTCERGGEINLALDESITQILGRNERAVVAKWVLLAESVTGDGERGLWQMTSPGSTAWDALGLLEYAKSVELASLNARTAKEGDDDI